MTTIHIRTAPRRVRLPRPSTCSDVSVAAVLRLIRIAPPRPRPREPATLPSRTDEDSAQQPRPKTTLRPGQAQNARGCQRYDDENETRTQLEQRLDPEELLGHGRRLLGLDSSVGRVFWLARYVEEAVVSKRLIIYRIRVEHAGQQAGRLI